MSSTSLRVASFNIRNGRAYDGCRSWPFRKRAVLATIEHLDADVIGLQEVHRFQRRWLEPRLTRYDLYGVGRDDGRRGEATLVLVDPTTVEVSDHVTRWFGDTPDVPGTRLPGAGFPRIATTLQLARRGSAQRVQLSNTHLDERSAARRDASIRQLLGWLDRSLPQVVMGDLNAVRGDSLFEAVEAAGLRSALPDDAGGTAHRFTGRLDGPRIDHVLVSEEVTVRGGRVVTTAGTRLASDHWPIVADLEV